MSWSDPARRFEPAEDRALRDELSDLLGMSPGPRNYFGTEATPEVVALAEKLRAEAERRRHTSRKRPSWMLVAAGLPFILAVASLGNWGMQHKRRADEEHVRALQAAQDAKAQADAFLRATSVSGEAERQRDREQKGFAASKVASKAPRKAKPSDDELVIPVENPLRTPTMEVQRVKAQGQ
jgi:hypothetical protein